MNTILNIDEIIKQAVKEGLNEYDKEKNTKKEDKMFHSTSLLLKNYKALKKHIDDVKDDIEFKVECAEDKIWLTSIVRTKLRTMKMMAFMDDALSIARKEMRKEGIEYKYRAFELYYIDGKTNEQIVSILGCGKNQPKIWSKLVIEKVSILLWGIEALGI